MNDINITLHPFFFGKDNCSSDPPRLPDGGQQLAAGVLRYFAGFSQGRDIGACPRRNMFPVTVMESNAYGASELYIRQ
jgi:hypothetical protein